jgi:transcriptional regulator with XRE-family HTH domain
MTLRDQLKHDLKAERYTFTHLCIEAQLSRPYLSRILGGYASPSVHVATSIALAANRLTGLDTYTPDQFLTIERINP